MDFRFSHEEEKFKEEVHGFFEKEAELVAKASEEHERSGLGRGGPYSRKLWRKAGEKGWICPQWPKQYGGLELPPIYKHIVDEELSYFGIAFNYTAAGFAGPIILHNGTEELKNEFLPRTARGEIEFALGYTEPQAGSDLAAIELRAEDKGDYFLLNGQKMFNSACHFSEYVWLLARTEKTTPKYKGLSFFIVDITTPGITVRPLWVLGGEKGTGLRSNEVFYDDVKVSKKYMVGGKNRGFYMLMEALAYERISPASGCERMLNDFVEYMKQTGKGKSPLVRQRVAELRIDAEVLKLLSKKICWMSSKREVPDVEAALAKTFTCNFYERLANLEIDVLGHYGLLHRDSKWAPMDGFAEWLYRTQLSQRIPRGTPEIMWNIIANRGLGLPR